MIKPKHGGAQVESKRIKEVHDKWCTDNGYRIKERKRTRYPQKSKNAYLASNFILP